MAGTRRRRGVNPTRSVHCRPGSWPAAPSTVGPGRGRSQPGLGPSRVRAAERHKLISRLALHRLGGRASLRGLSPGPSLCGARDPPWESGGGSSREPLTVRWSPPQPARSSAEWPPGSGQLRIGDCCHSRIYLWSSPGKSGSY